MRLAEGWDGAIRHFSGITFNNLMCVLLDFFRGPTVSNIRLAGLEYVLHFTALNGKIYFRSYK